MATLEVFATELRILAPSYTGVADWRKGKLGDECHHGDDAIEIFHIKNEIFLKAFCESSCESLAFVKETGNSRVVWCPITRQSLRKIEATDRLLDQWCIGLDGMSVCCR